MDLSSKPQMFFHEISPVECGAFLEFADRMNIPLNQEYLDQLRGHLDHKRFQLDAFELGVKDSKVHCPEDESLNDRRLQNALWRAWWRQKRIRLKTPKSLPLEDDKFEQLEEATTGVLSMLRGKEIGDIPTEYTIPTLQPHEIPVNGTYVDKKVSPGFCYKVRVNGTTEYLFGGKALLLERLGAGYGKRLTFESKDVLNNDNFFWSDSNPDGGFAFAIQVLHGGETFKVIDEFGREIGRAEIINVCSNQSIARDCVDGGNLIKYVNMDFEIAFLSDDNLPNNQERGNHVVLSSGTVVCQKTTGCQRAKVKEILNVDIPGFGRCILK